MSDSFYIRAVTLRDRLVSRRVHVSLPVKGGAKILILRDGTQTLLLYSHDICSKISLPWMRSISWRIMKEARGYHPKEKGHKYQLLSEASRICPLWWEQPGRQV